MAEKTDSRKTAGPDEAEKIYRAIFRKPIPPVLKDRYVEAAEILFENFSLEEKQAFLDVVRGVHDLEALEIAARQRKKMPLLVSRFRLMVHLAENLPSEQKYFINPSPRRMFSYFSLLVGAVRTLCKTLKGRLLLRRIGDA